jgi:hypothetical protein
MILSSCTKETETKIEAFGAEAFAYDIGDSWEVNATTRVKGYVQKEENNNFNATLTLDIDLITPGGDTLESFISKTEDFSEKEKMSDAALEAQFELDSTYQLGNYKIIFKVKDVNSGSEAATSAQFDISGD